MSEELQKSNAENPSRRPTAYAPPLDTASASAHLGLPQDPDDGSSIEQLAETVKSHTAEAADALRQGHIMEDAEADSSATSDDRLIALLCYWSQLLMPAVMPIIVLLSESGKRRPFQRHHAIQSLGLSGAFIGLTIATVMGLGIIMTIPIINIIVGLFAICLTPIAYFMIVTAYVFYGWQANKGKRFSIPILSRFLRRQGWLE